MPQKKQTKVGLEKRTKDELVQRACDLKIKNRSTMRKDELVKAIRSKNAGASAPKKPAAKKASFWKL